MKPRKKYLLYASVIIVGGGLLFILVETVRAKNTGLETKTLWDWMELLIIPLVLAGGAFYLNHSERAVERQTAEDRAKLERELATDRQQEAALQAYLDRMGELLLEKNLRTSENEEVRNVARIRTLTVLQGLDDIRKGFVLRFLHEAELIAKDKPIVDLRGANLIGADMLNANLAGAYLVDANLAEATLIGANLAGANLTRASLTRANLAGANLVDANLARAHLVDARLHFTNLAGAYLEGASLARANLAEANLLNANLAGADLTGADLTRATLTGAYLLGADLTGAKVTNKNLAEAKSLKGAIMPDGTKHE